MTKSSGRYPNQQTPPRWWVQPTRRYGSVQNAARRSTSQSVARSSVRDADTAPRLALAAAPPPTRVLPCFRRLVPPLGKGNSRGAMKVICRGQMIAFGVSQWRSPARIAPAGRWLSHNYQCCSARRPEKANPYSRRAEPRVLPLIPAVADAVQWGRRQAPALRVQWDRITRQPRSNRSNRCQSASG